METKSVSNIDAASMELIRNSQELRRSAKQSLKKSSKKFKKSGGAAQDAADSLAKSVKGFGKFAGHGFVGTAQALGQCGGGAVVGVATGTVGVAGKAAEESLGVLGWLSQKTSEAFAYVGNALSSKKELTITSKDIEGGKTSADKLLETSGESFAFGKNGCTGAFESYAKAVKSAKDAGVDAATMAGFTAVMAAYAAEGVANAGLAGVTSAGVAVDYAGVIALQASEAGLNGAAEASFAAAQLTNAIGNVLNSPANNDQKVIEMKKAQDIYDATLADIFSGEDMSQVQRTVNTRRASSFVTSNHLL
ncbi:MAG: hypothetical protein R3C68_17635 [Myxococcota bacterium]